MEWPFVGRESILRRLLGLLTREDLRGIELVGDAGVGKSRLAFELVGAAGAAGRATAWIAASRAMSGIPFGAVAHLLAGDPGGAPGEDFRRLGALQAELIARANADGRLVVGIDDAHLLDDRSAALLAGAIVRGEIAVVLTRTAGAEVSPILAEAWKDADLERITVPPLDRESTDRLVEAALGGPAEPLARAAFWRRSQGNALLLRELVLGALEAGALVRGRAGWQVRGELAPTGRLTELVELRLGRLDPTEREIVEAVAVAGELELDLVASGDLAADGRSGGGGARGRREGGVPGSVERLEERQLVVVGRSGNRDVVRLAHPIFADAIAAGLPRTRVRRILRGLADRLEASGWRRRDDLLRLAIWRLDGGGGADADLLTEAAGQALASFDAPLAERLARAALAARPDRVETLVVLGRALTTQQRVDDADTVLARASEVARADPDVARAALARAELLYFRAGRSEAAADLLRETREAIRDPGWAGEIDALLVLFAAGAADLVTFADACRRVAARPEVRPRTLAHAMMYGSIANVMLGRFAEAEGQVRLGTDAADAARDELPLVPDLLRINRMLGLAYGGEIRRAVAIGDAGYRAAVDAGAADAAAMWALNLTECRELAGDLEGAVRTMTAARETMRERDPFSAQGIAVAFLALLSAWLGRRDEARALHAEIVAAGLVTDGRSQIQFDRATVWTTWIDHGAAAAARAALGAGERAADATHLVWAAQILHDAVRLGHAALVRNPLAELAGSVEGRLVPAMARHAEVLTDGDPAALERVAGDFESLGAWLYAAEAMAQAEHAYLRRGEPVRARIAAARANLLAAHGPGAATPPLASAARAPLTSRELEIAGLAAEGRTSREIGRHLGISVRTVDNHLGAVYAKLGANGRSDLSAVFGVRSGAPPAQDRPAG